MRQPTKGKTVRIGIDGRYLQDHFPGIGRYIYNLVEHLARATDDQLVVLYLSGATNTRFPLQRLETHPNVALREVTVRPFSLGEQFRLWPLLWKERLQVFHSPYYWKPYWQPCPSVVTLYDVIPNRYPEVLPSRRARAVFNVAMRLAIATARRILTLSRCAAADLGQIYGVPAQKVVVTPLAADPNYVPMDRRSLEPVRRRYALPGEFILCVSSNKPHKNLARLIEAVARTPARLVVVGHQDPRYGRPHPALSALEAAGRVRFLGHVPEADLPALYNLAELFVFPSLYEGFGLPPLEAMACGVPVICSHSSSLPEVVGDAAWLIDPLDTEGWAQAIDQLLGDEALRCRLREKGLERAQQFSWEETARLTWRVYQEASRK